MARRLPKGWKYRELGDLARIGSGGTPSRSNADYWGGTMPWITAKELKTFDLVDSQERLSDAGAKRAAMAPENTVLVLVRGMGLFKDVPIGVTTRPMAFNQDIKVLHPKDGLSARFLGYALQAQRHYLMGKVDRAGHGTGRLPTNVLEELPLPVPPVDEQRRIIAVLDSCDHESTIAERALSSSEIAMKEVVAQLVFQGVRTPTSFNIMKLARLAKKGWKRCYISNIAEERRHLNHEDRKLPVLSSTKLKGIVFAADYFGKQVHSSNTATYKRVRCNEFVYATNHIEEGSIGLQSICDEGLVSPMYTVFSVDMARVDPEFLMALLKTETYRQIFEANTSASVDRRGSLRWKDFSRLPVHLPSPEVQREIVAQISTMRRLVELQERRVDLLRQRKRGLMQKLVTGQWRLTRDLPGMEASDG